MTNAKKHLGQHFLTSKKALREMLDAGNVTKHDTVLEIGPGKGVLTRALLDTGARVVVVETDKGMLPILEETFASECTTKQLTIVHEDILEVSLTTTNLSKTPFNICGEYKVIANIPYYITGEIIRRFLVAENQPQTMVLLVQKEVAERIAKSKKESVLSLSVKAYGQPRYVSTVAARYFNPPPKVDSAVLAISNISKKFFEEITEERFFKVVKSGFSSKRKKLTNNLSSFGSKQHLETTLSRLGLNENLRAEDVSLEEWVSLARELK